jgi:hypothetical protein
MGRRPDFYIIGAPKAGTTAMYEYLRQHPQIYMPERKELRYFGSDLEIRDRTPLTLEQYLDYFRDAGDAARVGTAYVWYLYSSNAAREIHEFAPHASVLVMLRNPVDAIYALHSENLFNGNEDIADIRAALAAEPDRRAGRRIPPHSHLVQGLFYSEVPRYSRQLERYFDVFGRDCVHVIIFDDFVSDPAAAYRETLAFLGVDTAFSPREFAVINANKRVRSEAFRHWLSHPPHLPRRIIRATVPQRLRRGAYELAKRANVTTPARPPMPADLRQQLRDQFAPEIDRLGRLLGRDLNAWSRPPI